MTTVLTDEAKEHLHADIDRRYAHARKPSKKVPIAALRLRELNILARHRWHHQLPDDDVGRVFVRVVANHQASLAGDPGERIFRWVELWAPWLDEDELDEIVQLATLSTTHYTADSVANAIGLDYATRKLLRIRTIGATDFPKAARLARRREKHAERVARHRRAAGAKARDGSISAARPWETIGISRATFYRNRERYGRMFPTSTEAS
jgi:hypothetical protein